MPAFGWIMGYVEDENSNPLSTVNNNVDITVEQLSVNTDNDGYYICPKSPGIYDMTVSADGFFTDGPTEIRINEGVVTTENITLVENANVSIQVCDWDLDWNDCINLALSGDFNITISDTDGSNATTFYKSSFENGKTILLTKPPGNYKIECSADNKDYVAINPITLVGGSTVQLRFQMREGTSSTYVF